MAPVWTSRMSADRARRAVGWLLTKVWGGGYLAIWWRESGEGIEISFLLYPWDVAGPFADVMKSRGQNWPWWYGGPTIWDRLMA